MTTIDRGDFHTAPAVTRRQIGTRCVGLTRRVPIPGASAPRRSRAIPVIQR